MRQKELRIALVCYGGVSLAVYMHGVTKEVWKLARASRALHDGSGRPHGVEGAYYDLLKAIADRHGLRIRVLTDILAGASAGGINAVFLAQAIHSGYSLEPLTDLWLENADVDSLIDPEAKPNWRYSKIWVQPATSYLLRRKESAVSRSVSPETRAAVRRKVSHLIRSRWFEPPFSGPGLTHLLHDAILAMPAGATGAPLLPPGHPLDLLVTATDFHGFPEKLHLHSPALVEENEHRMSISFRGRTPAEAGTDLAEPLELTFAARATASFPGAFPPLQLSEIDEHAARNGTSWPDRQAFIERVMPRHFQSGLASRVSLIDGSVLVNAPFAEAISVLPARPAQREVDRRFVYIDPTPDRLDEMDEKEARNVGFFRAIFGSLSTIPREQPIRDNLETLERHSREAERLRRIVTNLRPQVEAEVERLFARTKNLDQPNPERLAAWRQVAQKAAEESAGFAFHAYEITKLSNIVDRMAASVVAAAPQLGFATPEPVITRLRRELDQRGLFDNAASGRGSSAQAIAFLRAHDLTFRIRRLRLLARRLSREWEADPAIPDQALDEARDAVYHILALYFERDGEELQDAEFAGLAANVMEDPARVIDALDRCRALPQTDEKAEIMLTEALMAMPEVLRRKVLFAYLGFPFYDAATFPLLGNEGLTEFEGVKVDRISPDDAQSIREGGARATLRGIEFFHFGAFFSRVYRENDYLWGRLHGAERMIDLVCSTMRETLNESEHCRFKRQTFLAILEEDEERLQADPTLVAKIRAEILARMPDPDGEPAS